MINIPAAMSSCPTCVEGHAYHDPGLDAGGLSQHIGAASGHLPEPAIESARLHFSAASRMAVPFRATQTLAGVDMPLGIEQVFDTLPARAIVDDSD